MRFSIDINPPPPPPPPPSALKNWKYCNYCSNILRLTSHSPIILFPAPTSPNSLINTTHMTFSEVRSFLIVRADDLLLLRQQAERKETKTINTIVSTTTATDTQMTITERGRSDASITSTLVTISVGLHSSSPLEEMATPHVTSGERSWACIDIGVPEITHSSRFPRSCDVEANNVPWIIPRYVTCRGEPGKQRNPPFFILSVVKSHWQWLLTSRTTSETRSSALLTVLSICNG